LPGAAGTARGLRDRPLGKIAILVAILVAALLVAKSCGKTDPELTKEEAIEVAKGAIDYEPECVFVRLIKRGFQSRETWAVSLSKPSGPDTSLVNVIQVDGDTGQVVEVRKGTQARVKC
jgi:hypothetical protein